MKTMLDTCVISELIARRSNLKVVAYVDSLEPENVYLSAITIGEIVKGIEKLSVSPRKKELLTWLQEDLLVRFEGKIVPLDAEVLIEWGVLTARLESAGLTMPAMDSLIAASVRAHRMSLVTRNVHDFDGADLEIINPWIDK